MACGNNNNRGGNLGGLKNILDFNVTYTGCETSCGGREIKTGDSLRNVLDALVANCDGGSGPVGSSTNFWFSRNVPTFTADVKENDFALTGSGAIYEFIDGEWQNTGIQIGGGGGGGDSVWGSITGAIADQTDLTEYINLLIGESAGKNIHVSDDGKINAGVKLMPFEGIDIHNLILTPKGDEVLELSDVANTDGIAMIGIYDEDQGVSQSSIEFKATSNENSSKLAIEGGLIDVLANQFTANCATGIRLTHDQNSYIRLNAEGLDIRDGSKSISLASTSSSFVGEAGTINITNQAGRGIFITANQDKSASLRADGGKIVAHSDTLHIVSESDEGIYIVPRIGGGDGVKAGFRSTNIGSSGDSRQVLVLDATKSTFGQTNYDSAFRYPDGMPLQSYITDDMVPSIAYIRDNMIQSLQDTVDAQATQIADLTARIEALENA